MIDLASENLISLREAARRLPGRRGRGVHIATVYRWAQSGVAGVRLEVLRLGGQLVTSVESLQRFAEQLSKSSDCEQLRSRRSPKKASARAGKVLDELGI